MDFDVTAHRLVALKYHVKALPSHFVALMFEAALREADGLSELLLVLKLVSVPLQYFVNELELSYSRLGFCVRLNGNFSGVGEHSCGANKSRVACHLEQNVFSSFSNARILFSELRKKVAEENSRNKVCTAFKGEV